MLGTEAFGAGSAHMGQVAEGLSPTLGVDQWQMSETTMSFETLLPTDCSDTGYQSLENCQVPWKPTLHGIYAPRNQ